jgi:hypothetical protein
VRSSSCLAELPTIAAAAKCRHPRKCIARRIALANGLHYVYAGNVHDRKGGSTYCPQCGTRVIERDWYELGAWQLTDTDEGKRISFHTCVGARFRPGRAFDVKSAELAPQCATLRQTAGQMCGQY